MSLTADSVWPRSTPRSIGFGFVLTALGPRGPGAGGGLRGVPPEASGDSDFTSAVPQLDVDGDGDLAALLGNHVYLDHDSGVFADAKSRLAARQPTPLAALRS